jgi:hypothetical protein
MSLPLLVLNKISFYCLCDLIGKGSKKKAIKQFLTVSRLAQHLESSACDRGKGTFMRVVKYVQEEIKGIRFSRLKLLS